MRKILTLILILAMCAPAFGARYTKKELQIVDEWGDAVTNIDQIEIYDAGTSTTSTIYKDGAGNTSITNPLTTSSTNTTFSQSQGRLWWYSSGATYKVTVTESGASQSLTIDNFSMSKTRFPWFVNYIGEAATLQVTDTTTLDIGTSDDFLHDWDNDNSRYVIYSASDGGRLDFGKASYHTDVYFHAGDITTDYIFFNEGSLQMSFVDIDLLIDDESKLLIGDSGDVTVEYDESNEDLDITSTTALDEISFGATGDGYDLVWWGTTATENVLFDYSNDELFFNHIDIQLDDDALLIFGTGDDFSVYSDTDKVLEFDPGTAGASIYFGTSDTDAVDIKWFSDVSGNYVLFDEENDLVSFVDVDITLDDEADLIIGAGSEWVIDNSSEVLRIIGSDDTDDFSVTIGVTTEGVDLKVWGATASTYMQFDASADELFLDLADLKLSDQSQIEFVDATDGVDWTVDCVTADTLLFTCATTDETPAFLIGVDQAGADFGLYGAAASAYLKWDASVNALWVEGADIFLGDSDLLVFGDAIGTGDIKVYATGTDLIIDGIQADTGTVAIGVTDHGLDFKLWAATNAEGVLWDASDEALEFTGANITLDAASVLTLGQTVNADTIVTTGTYAVLAANSGKIHVIPDLAGATSIDLPAEADGLYYKFIYVGAQDEAHTHTIDSENNTNCFIGGVAFADTDAGDAADEINAGVYSNGSSNSKLALINMSAGTVVEVHCDGEDWYVTGIVFSATIPTFADQS